MLKRLLDRESQSKLIQFLMGLNNSYESIKTHVLSMDLLPPINKAFAILQNVGRQKQISDTVEVLAEANAYACTSTPDRPGFSLKKPRVDSLNDGSVKTCNYCHHLGHTKEECFKLNECSHCGRKGHAKENCFRLRNNFSNRFGKGRGRGRTSTYKAHLGT
ncbi:hypothetical protein RND81_14G158600 [Saponaria officinalis]|uniref:CCHC-type domain-containing protein n=1 Tax=Saponaria officinalis TaxID=3572 RepID=A0AAW1GML4_SAPOF